MCANVFAALSTMARTEKGAIIHNQENIWVGHLHPVKSSTTANDDRKPRVSVTYHNPRGSPAGPRLQPAMVGQLSLS